MLASRKALVAAITLVVVLAVGGVFWLVRLATNGAHSSGTTSTSASRTPTTTPTSGPSQRLPTPTTTPAGPAASAPAPPATPPQTPGSSRPPAPRTTQPGPRSTPPVPSRAIRVGGATLDNTNPRTPCAGFKNTQFNVPVAVTGIVLSEPGVQISAGDCGEDDNMISFPANRACTVGTILRPGEPGCYTGINATNGAPGTEHRRVVTLMLKARCTNSAGAPCSAPEVRALAPSSSRPVDATWPDAGRAVCIRVPEDPAGNVFCAA